MSEIHKGVVEAEISQMMAYMEATKRNKETTRKLIRKVLIDENGQESATEEAIDRNVAAYNVWRKTVRSRGSPQLSG